MEQIFLFPLFKLNPLSSFIAVAIGVFFFLTLIYSFSFMRGKRGQGGYYLYIILSAVAGLGTVLTNNLCLLLVFWGFLGLTLYLLINMGGELAPRAARKMLFIVGGTDALMIFGIGIIYYLTRTFQMDTIRVPLSGPYANLSTVAYLCIAVACFAKAGAMPFHSWIPDAAQSAPASVVAFLPASIDKLLGIYLLARISLDLFTINLPIQVLLLIIGAGTIVLASMMALVQSNMKRLLGYCAVSQVGYIILGIAIGTPLGIAAALFHMLNHAVYKAGLFFGAGNVEYRLYSSDFKNLGGLARLMPVTYISVLIASLAASGVPPFSAFVSKWMVYQGMLSQIGAAGQSLRIVLIVCLFAAMFGSGLTLASFMKLIHAVFLGQGHKDALKTEFRIQEVPFLMWLPPLLLACVCVVFGIFAFRLPLEYFIFPAGAFLCGGVSLAGSLSGWPPMAAAGLVAGGIAAGIIFYWLTRSGFSLRQDTSFTGTEDLPEDPLTRVSGVDFYNSIKEYGILRGLYRRANEGGFDIYKQSKKFLYVSEALQYLHNGVLSTYLVWILLGMLGLIFYFFL